MAGAGGPCWPALAPGAPSSRNHWYLVVHYKGQRWKERAGPTKATALEAAKVFQRRLAAGEFEEGRPVAEVQQFYERCTELGRPRAPRTFEIVLGTLRRILLHAQAQELVPSNAVSDWKMLRGRRRGTGIRPLERERVLAAQEVEDLLAAAREHASQYYVLLLFLTDTGCRIGEALALRWTDCHMEAGLARIERSVDHLGRVGPTKTRRARAVELSGRLAASLAARCPGVFGADALVFPSEAGGYLDSTNVRNRVFARLVRRLWGRGRRVTPHDLRHTWVSRHLAAGTPIKWIQERGGWRTAKILLDVYGHFMPTEIRGFADVVAGIQPTTRNAPQAHPRSQTMRRDLRTRTAKPLSSRGERWSRRPDSNR